MTDDRARTALNELSDALGAAAAEYDRLRASSETADQNLQAFADAVSQAADSLRTLCVQGVLGPQGSGEAAQVVDRLGGARVSAAEFELEATRRSTRSSTSRSRPRARENPGF